MTQQLSWLSAARKGALRVSAAGILTALLVAFSALVPLNAAHAASLPTGAAIQLDQASKPALERAYHYGRPHYRGYYGRPVYRGYYGYRRPGVYFAPPRAYRPCVVRKRWVATPYGYRLRPVRICR